jgi:hypothetical protein
MIICKHFSNAESFVGIELGLLPLGENFLTLRDCDTKENVQARDKTKEHTVIKCVTFSMYYSPYFAGTVKRTRTVCELLVERSEEARSDDSVE